MSSPQTERRIDRLLAEYERDHRDPTNRRLHYLAVPLIFFCVVALVTELPVPDALKRLPGGWLLFAAIPAAIYYFRRSVSAGLVMVVFTLLCLGVIELLHAYVPVPVWLIALGLFVILWVVQYVGHKIEGRRPSFFKDAQFLLIGPVWVFDKLLRSFGFRY
ncbi:Mpo1-like protein [Filomicrobium sp.]|mgnify:CR=1 FL=1|uniref:Mpo1 family 2-hydroxy fatty acid dioxygenase n=1 Tax=Filomicrobium sp. TaxID=2024831 RepID=UPI0025849A37|nr:Mpo1-like protein [Filomicrobium sp.]MCV0369034.1 DUF962 domain-containing protein [Filomicrobium sp.]